MNIHLEDAYAEQGSHRVATGLCQSILAQQHSIILPLFAQMTESDLTAVVNSVQAWVSASELAIGQVG